MSSTTAMTTRTTVEASGGVGGRGVQDRGDTGARDAEAEREDRRRASANGKDEQQHVRDGESAITRLKFSW